MKDSGVEWLGEVPEHWGVSQPRYLCRFVGGGTPSKDNLAFWNGDLPWVSPKDMKQDLVSDSIDKITEEAVLASSVNLIPSGSVLMVVRGMILIHSVPVALTTRTVTINQDMKAMVVDRHRLNGTFWLRHLQGVKNVLLDLTESSAHGTKCLRSEGFEKLSVPIPPLDEQLHIVNYLTSTLERIDKTHDKANKLIHLAEERRTALISAAVTGKIDLRGWTQPGEVTA
ncbi:restriction endonuclease subunit S [Leclercia adecarboxylata]